MNFANWLQARRALRGLSQNALAKASGTTSATISMLESGDRKPSREMVEKIVLALSDDENVQSQFRQDGLLAAGFLPDEMSQELTREPDPEYALLYGRYEGLSSKGRSILLEMSQRLYDLERGDTDDTVATSSRPRD